jgi:hypothetical protein
MANWINGMQVRLNSLHHAYLLVYTCSCTLSCAPAALARQQPTSCRITTNKQSSSLHSAFVAASTPPPPLPLPSLLCRPTPSTSQIPLTRARFGRPHQPPAFQRRPPRQPQRLVRPYAIHRPASVPHARPGQHQQRAGACTACSHTRAVDAGYGCNALWWAGCDQHAYGMQRQRRKVLMHVATAHQINDAILSLSTSNHAMLQPHSMRGRQPPKPPHSMRGMLKKQKNPLSSGPTAASASALQHKRVAHVFTHAARASRPVRLPPQSFRDLLRGHRQSRLAAQSCGAGHERE